MSINFLMEKLVCDQQTAFAMDVNRKLEQCIGLERLRQWMTLIVDTWHRQLTNGSWPLVDIRQVLVSMSHSALRPGTVRRQRFEAWNPIRIMRPLTGGCVADFVLSVCLSVCPLSVPSHNSWKESWKAENLTIWNWRIGFEITAESRSRTHEVQRITLWVCHRSL